MNPIFLSCHWMCPVVNCLPSSSPPLVCWRLLTPAIIIKLAILYCLSPLPLAYMWLLFLPSQHNLRCPGAGVQELFFSGRAADLVPWKFLKPGCKNMSWLVVVSVIIISHCYFKNEGRGGSQLVSLPHPGGYQWSQSVCLPLPVACRSKLCTPPPPPSTPRIFRYSDLFLGDFPNFPADYIYNTSNISTFPSRPSIYYTPMLSLSLLPRYKTVSLSLSLSFRVPAHINLSSSTHPADSACFWHVLSIFSSFSEDC